MLTERRLTYQIIEARLFCWTSGLRGAVAASSRSPGTLEFDKKYRQQGLAVIGVSMDEDGWKAVKPFLARKTDPETGGNTAMKYPVVIGSDQLAKQYNLTSMPMTLLIDRQGKIALSHTGVVNKNDFEGHILQLLN
jgi:peroxiredoxin